MDKDGSGANNQSTPLNKTGTDTQQGPSSTATSSEYKAENKTPRRKSAPTGVKHGKHKVICITAIAATLATFIVAGFFVTRIIMQSSEQYDETAATNPGTTPGQSQSSIAAAPTTPISDSALLLPSDDNLTLALLKLHNDDQNSCYSPLSIRYALEMLREGANGDTKTQIENLIGTGSTKRYENVVDHLSVANSLWVDETLRDKIKTEYADTLNQKFGASLMIDPFANANNVNQWISDNTFGLIPEALNDEDVAGMMSMLINVLAIDMNWEWEFDKLSTFGGYFNYTDDTAEDDTYATMRADTNAEASHDTHYYYSLAGEATIFASDLKEYGDTTLQFVAIMPDDLRDFINSIQVDTLNQLLAGIIPAKATNDTYDFSFTAYIPKFEITGGIENLVADLKTLGITNAFDAETADFSNWIDIDNFAVDAATHKTKFDFSEEGIKAAAVTIMGGKGSSGGGPIPSSVRIVVSINKPFMYLVRDKASGEIWFAGTVYNPTRWQDVQANYGR